MLSIYTWNSSISAFLHCSQHWCIIWWGNCYSASALLTISPDFLPSLRIRYHSSSYLFRFPDENQPLGKQELLESSVRRKIQLNDQQCSASDFIFITGPQAQRLWGYRRILYGISATPIEHWTLPHLHIRFLMNIWEVPSRTLTWNFVRTVFVRFQYYEKKL